MEAIFKLSSELTPEWKAFIDSFGVDKFWRIVPARERCQRAIVVLNGKAYPVDGIEMTGKPLFAGFVDRNEFVLETTSNNYFLLSRSKKILLPESKPRTEIRKSGRRVLYYDTPEKFVTLTISNNLAVI